MILPFLEQTVLYNSINFVAGGITGGFAQGDCNQTLAQTTLNVLICPSDPSLGMYSKTNYGWNGGFGMQETDFVGTFGSAAVRRLNYIGPSSITDGLSNTSAASEWKIGAIQSDDDSTVVFQVGVQNGENYSSFIKDCLAATRATTAFGSWTKNATWYDGAYGSTMLNFNSTPNSHNCIYGFSIDYANFPCSSYHSNGVNMLFLDGHVQFMSNSVSLSTFQAVSTRSGGDNVQF